jgi:hypothetical protein
MEDTWEIDVQEMTLDDLEMLQAGIVNTSNAGEIKQFLGHLVTNKTPEEIGKVRLRDLHQQLVRIGQIIDELAVPKENATP